MWTGPAPGYNNNMPELDTGVTQLLHEWGDGDPDALPRLIPLVFRDLHRIAASQFAREPAGHTLQPTALVNEVFLRLVERRKVHWQSRAHFFAFAAQLVRRILVDHARSRKRDKRGGGAQKTSLTEAAHFAAVRHYDLVALDNALNDLEKIDPQGSRVVEMRFFAGLGYEEIAQVLGVAPSTVRRRWRSARSWLYRQLSA